MPSGIISGMPSVDPPPSEKRIESMSRVEKKVWENKVRRIAARRRLRLQKTRRRDPGAFDYGIYTLIDAKGAVLATGPLAEIHAWLLSMPR